MIRFIRKILNATEAGLAFKTALAAGLSFIFGTAFAQMFDRPDILVSGLWCVIASIVVMQAHLGGTYSAAWMRFLGVLIGTIAGIVALTYFGNNAYSLAGGVFCTIVLCALLGIKDSFRVAGMSTAIVLIAGNGIEHVVPPWLFGWYRFVDSCLGIVIAVIVASFVWPEKAIDNIRKNVGKILYLLSKYYLGAASLDSSSSDHVHISETLLSEIEETLEKNREYRKEAEFELISHEEKFEYWTLICDQLESILDAVNALRTVEKDTVAKICDDELVKRLDDVIDRTNLAFQSLEDIVNTRMPKPAPIDALAVSLKLLNEDLSRFRGTRTTRRFNLEDVENFYTFFHSLRMIGESIIKINANVSPSYANHLHN